MKTIFYGSLIMILLCLLIVVPLAYIIIADSGNIEIIKQNCLSTGGTVVEFEGKFERCIPR